MKISKISRSLIVAIFLAFIIFLGYLNFSIIISGQVAKASVTSNLVKLAYGIGLIILVLIYVYIKDKLYRLKVKRNLAFVYRYIYLTLVILAACLFSFRTMFLEYTNTDMAIYIIFTIMVAFCMKKIVFNVSKSDMLSVFGMLGVAMIPNIISNKADHFTALLITLSIIASVLVLQYLIDELKQRGIKTRKYILLSAIMGLFMGISTLCGVSIFVWIITAIVLVFITSNLDSTHINFPKKLMASITQSKREKLYRIERININKVYVSILVYFAVVIATFYIGNLIIKFIPEDIAKTEIVTNIKENIESTKTSNVKLSDAKQNIIDFSRNFVGTSKTYYMTIFIYIMLVEILALVLRRRYDTKSTVIKTILMLLLASSAICNLNVLYFQPICTTLLLLIAIVCTSNLYLNREERVKMLVS